MDRYNSYKLDQGHLEFYLSDNEYNLHLPKIVCMALQEPKS